MDALTFFLPLLAAGADKVPAPADVKAGWGALAMFVALAVAVGFLMWSMTRHLRKARDNADLGHFDPSDESHRRSS
jgi:hypothetical protein